MLPLWTKPPLLCPFLIHIPCLVLTLLLLQHITVVVREETGSRVIKNTILAYSQK